MQVLSEHFCTDFSLFPFFFVGGWRWGGGGGRGREKVQTDSHIVGLHKCWMWCLLRNRCGLFDLYACKGVLQQNYSNLLVGICFLPQCWTILQTQVLEE